MGESLEGAIDRLLVPELRRRGFRGSRPHFRRLGRQRVDLLTIEIQDSGDRFSLVAAVAPPGGILTAGGHLVAPRELRADALPSGWRTILAPVGSDAGECAEEETGLDDRFERAVQRELEALDWAENWWSDRGQVLIGTEGPEPGLVLAAAGGALVLVTSVVALRSLLRSRGIGLWVATAALGWGLCLGRRLSDR